MLEIEGVADDLGYFRARLLEPAAASHGSGGHSRNWILLQRPNSTDDSLRGVSSALEVAPEPGLLSLDEDLVMVGLSTSIFEKDTLKCFVSTLVKPTKHKFHRLVKYKQEVGSNWLKKQFDLRFYTSKHYGEKLLVKDAWDSLPYAMDRFSSLHASKDCIILGKMPPYGQKTECTYWVRRSVVGSRNWQCDFIFDAFCKSQAIVVNKKNIDTCK
ncbi:uncharacterized protein LOC142588166 [Dermacentor variabilis]|uniref:uncharacterized protein LOC142588166 n=1 Tax=Dermacentor variabilis TaxID=34621 RepID=UPI003F5C3BB1